MLRAITLDSVLGAAKAISHGNAPYLVRTHRWYEADQVRLGALLGCDHGEAALDRAAAGRLLLGDLAFDSLAAHLLEDRGVVGGEFLPGQGRRDGHGRYKRPTERRLRGQHAQGFRRLSPVPRLEDHPKAGRV